MTTTTATPTPVCACGGNSTTEVYHDHECPLYRVQRAGLDLLKTLERVADVRRRLVGAAAAQAWDKLTVDIEAAIRKATEI